jgi:hypothetical protein
MKIALVVISNRPEKMKTCVAATFRHAMVSSHKYQLCLSYQDPYTVNDLAEIDRSLPKGVEFNFAYRKPPEGPLFNFVEARLHSFWLAERAEADYLIWVDDDFRFTNGSTTQLGVSTGRRYSDAVYYLKKYPECGLVQMTGFLGGANSGRYIQPFFNGFYETACGLVMRGKDRAYGPLIDPRLNVIGGGSDPATFVTSLINGFYVAKTFNTPLRKDPSKKIFVPSGRSGKHLTDNQNYSQDYLTTVGVHAQITKHFGEYRHGKRISRPLYQTYRLAAKRRGHEIKSAMWMDREDQERLAEEV